MSLGLAGMQELQDRKGDSAGCSDVLQHSYVNGIV